MTDPDATAARSALDAALSDPARLDAAPLTALPPTALDDTLRAFADAHGAAALPVLEALAAPRLDRALRRAARLAVYRLAQRGVAAPARPPARPVVERRAESAARAWLSGIDGSGSRAVWVLFDGALRRPGALLAHRQRRGRHSRRRRRRDRQETAGDGAGRAARLAEAAVAGGRARPRGRPRRRGVDPASHPRHRAARRLRALGSALRRDRTVAATGADGRPGAAGARPRPCWSCRSWPAGSSTRSRSRATRWICCRRARASSSCPIRSRASARTPSSRGSSSAS